ncbi:1,2-phenylacetyl-CoA epoxidase subunit PaaE [Luethyella okanaganae]|uniref:1,2-phenylacetyl-CoA epoxidase subunit PaaE n=1 Tax=Luethyella okanaganae TaxID=69372 RepID=A0ABW1VBV5_9MICO
MSGARATKPRRRARFHTLTVSGIRQLTDDAIEVTFAIPPELSGHYDYDPGQFVAIRADVDGVELRRSYSICAAPAPGELRIAIKHDLGGAFSTWANMSLRVGDELDVMSPEGAFTTEIGPGVEKHYVAVAAGSGVTPVVSLAHSVLERSPESRFTLVYSNRTALDTMFLEELADLKDTYPARLALHHVLTRETRSSPLLSGRIDHAKLQAILTLLVQPENVDEWFLCGPFELVQLCRDTLAEMGVASEDIHYELFTTGRPEAPEGSHGRPVLEDAGGATHAITFTLDGRTATVTTPVHGRESVLNAALRVRPDVPFACAGGVCGTCRATLVSGTVEMEENYALEPEELEAGYVLTCQSLPTSEAVTVNYDA